jgi:Ni/Co efflux regulator RcnB
MKRLLTAVCALAILTPGLALAQDQDGRRDPSDQRPSGGRNGYAGRTPPPGIPQPQAQAPAPQPAPAPPQAQPDRGGRRGDDGNRGDRGDRGGRFNGGGDNRGQDNRGPGGENRRFDRGDRNDNRGPGDDNRRFDRGDRRGPDNRGFDNDRRFDNNNRPGFDNNRRFDNNRGERFRYGNRDFYRFRAQPYAWPRGFGARSWRPRELLPRFFFEDRYYIDNFFELGLPPPPYGYRWLRVGDDALLVDLRNGLIADVIPGVFFW